MSDGLERIRTPLRRAMHFLGDGVWDVEMSSFTGLRRMGIKAVRVVHLVVKGFVEDQCPLHASSLTFSTLMSIVPVLAVSLALARGLGAGDNFEVWCREKARVVLIEKASVPVDAIAIHAKSPDAAVTNGGAVVAVPDKVPAEELASRMDNLIEQLFGSVRNVSFAKLGGVGLLILVWSVVQVLGRVESSFNKVWGVTTGRPLFRKILDYLSVLIIVPILAVAASSLPALTVISKFLDHSVGMDPAIGTPFATVVDMVVSVKMKGVIVVGMATLAFAFMIMFMPNTKVKLKAGLGGGLVAALLFIVWMELCIAVQIGVAKYSSIYGTFAAVPIVLFWVYVSWQIILLGAEVAFALQNVSTYRMEMQAHSSSARSRFVVAMSVMKVAAKALLGNDPVFEAGAFAKENRVPVRLVNQVLRELTDAGLLAELSARPGFFVLLKSPDSIMVRDLFNVAFGSEGGLKESGLDLGGTVGDIMHKADVGLDAALAGLSTRSLAAKT